MRHILFLCTGNYYRSRHAEIVFNWRIRDGRIPWRASSRGLGLVPANNPGPISRHTLRRLDELQIPVPVPLEFPQDLQECDLIRADKIVALKEAEHRAMMTDRFPNWLDRVEYWRVDDLDCAGPDVALPQIESLVETLVLQLGTCAPTAQPHPPR